MKFSLYFQPTDQDQAAVFDLLNRAGRKKTFLILSLLSVFVNQFPDFPVENLSKKQIAELLYLYFPSNGRKKTFTVNNISQTTINSGGSEKKRAFPTVAKKQFTATPAPPSTSTELQQSADNITDEPVIGEPQEDDLLLLDGLNMF